MYVNYQQDNWVNLIPLAEVVYNNMSHSVTMVTPFFANKGFHPKLEVSLKSVVSDTAHQVTTDLKNCISTSMIKSLMPSGSMRSMWPPDASQSHHSKS